MVVLNLFNTFEKSLDNVVNVDLSLGHGWCLIWRDFENQPTRPIWEMRTSSSWVWLVTGERRERDLSECEQSNCWAESEARERLRDTQFPRQPGLLLLTTHSLLSQGTRSQRNISTNILLTNSSRFWWAAVQFRNNFIFLVLCTLSKLFLRPFLKDLREEKGQIEMEGKSLTVVVVFLLH